MGPTSSAASAVRNESVRAVAHRSTVWSLSMRPWVSTAAGCSLVVLVIWSAILAKTSNGALPLAEIRVERLPEAAAAVSGPASGPTSDSSSTSTASDRWTTSPDITDAEALPPATTDNVQATPAQPEAPWMTDATIRWFNGRPAKPARTIHMQVTAYSPDSRSCGTSDDGLTATLHSVETNGFRLVAADPKVLPYGSMVSVEGYDKGMIVPVLDCGGAIKGNHIDLLFPTHQQARAWGNKMLDVVVWEYIDGKPAENPRLLR